MNIKIKFHRFVRMNDIITIYNSSKNKNELELEARICFVYNNHGKIISNINVYDFKAILSNGKNHLHKYNETIECYEFGRKIIQNDDNTIYQKKENMITYIHNTNHKFLKIKWSLNIEQNLSPTVDIGKLQYIRKKYVNVYSIHPKWNMFLIEAYSQTIRLKTYEIEFERFNDESTISNNEIYDIQNIIYSLFKNRFEFKIVKQFNSFFTNKILHNVFWPVNKPINLKFDMWNKIKYNYYYYIKLDGERFLFFTTISHLYIFNDTSQIHVKENKIFPPGCIIDCEYMDNDDTYHVFDVLVWNNKDVRYENLDKRYSYLQSMVDLFPSYIRLMKLYKKFDENLWNIVKKSNIKMDGIIFTPRYEHYKNNCTYKYKPRELLTIDFMIDVEQKLYSINNDSNYVLFQGTEEYPYTQSDNNKIIYNFQYQLYDIIEFHYDYNLKIFLPLKIRYDKIRPNNISVALDVWYDIHNPIDIISFIQNIT